MVVLVSVPVLNTMQNSISPRRRELMHRAMDGETELVGVMQILHNYKFCDNILTWLIAHRMTGKSLRELVIKFHSSVPRLVDFVVEAANGKDMNAERGRS